MIEKIIVENFGPIYDETEILFTIGNYVEEYSFEDFNVIPNTNLLKSIFFYGGNNSGKSQVLKLFELLKEISHSGSNLFEKIYFLPNVYIKEDLLGSLKKLTKIKYFFNINNIKYSYELEICFGEKSIYKEVLKKSNDLIFERIDNHVNLSISNIEKNIFYLTHQLSKEGDNESIKEIYNFMRNLVFINPEVHCGNLKSFNSSQIEKLELNLTQINETLNNFGFDFKIDVKKWDELLDTKTKDVLVSKGTLLSKFGVLESFGTECFLKLLIEIINVNSNTIVIDEIERGLNFELLSQFLKFLNKTFPHKQFIFATHMTDLLEGPYRKDQFYTTDITSYKLILSRSFDKRKFRSSHNFRKLYVSGAIGGISKVKKENPFNSINKEVDTCD